MVSDQTGYLGSRQKSVTCMTSVRGFGCNPCLKPWGNRNISIEGELSGYPYRGIIKGVANPQDVISGEVTVTGVLPVTGCG